MMRTCDRGHGVFENALLDAYKPVLLRRKEQHIAPSPTSKKGLPQRLVRKVSHTWDSSYQH